ncbi:MAG: glycosyltransferase [Rhizobiales bacterium]|nr:glycosyltransferase [Hyphomicrobiales bacterium]
MAAEAERRGADVGPVGSLALVAPDPEAVRPLVGPLLEELSRDALVTVGFGGEPQGETAQWLASIGIDWHEVALRGDGFEPAAQVRAMAALSRRFKSAGITSVLGLGPTGALFAGLAGRLARTPRIVALIDSLPGDIALEATGFRERVRRATARRLLSAGLTRLDAAFFVRGPDADMLEEQGLLPERLEMHIGRGVDVDVDAIAARPLPQISGGMTFLAAGPLVASQGLREFCLAALALSDHGVRANWQLLASEGRGPDAIDPSLLPGLGEVVSLVPTATPTLEALAGAHVFVLPARLDQVPEVAVEALAVGRPIVATDVPAHRVLVDEPVNGVFVAPNDVAALADGMAYCLRRPDLVASMSRASRTKAERLFAKRNVSLALRRILELPDAPTGTTAGRASAGMATGPAAKEGSGSSAAQSGVAAVRAKLTTTPR